MSLQVAGSESTEMIFNPVAPTNVHLRIDNKTAHPLPESLMFDWDIRLDWGAVEPPAH